VVTGACERVYEDGTRQVCPPDPRAWDKISVQNVIEQTATFWRRELHRRVAPLDHRRFPYVADWDLWVRMKEAGARLRTTDRVLSRYHFTAHNQTSRAGRRFADEAFKLLRLRGPLGGLLPTSTGSCTITSISRGATTAHRPVRPRAGGSSCWCCGR
jgi:hypothetical protein